MPKNKTKNILDRDQYGFSIFDCGVAYLNPGIFLEVLKKQSSEIFKLSILQRNSLPLALTQNLTLNLTLNLRPNLTLNLTLYGIGLRLYGKAIPDP